MTLLRNRRGYYFITDRGLSLQGNEADVRAACAAGAALVQYRDKTLSSRALYEEALRLKALCRGVPFIVNDRLDIALAVDADRLHVGQDDLPIAVARRFLGREKTIGASVRTLAEAERARDEGADYLGYGPVFPTATKADAGAACGLELLKIIKHETGLPVVAIGGLTPENAPLAIAAGADMVSAISAVVAAPDPGAVMAAIKGLYS